MELVTFLQGSANSFLTFLSSIFDLFGTTGFFVLVFALSFLVVSKENSFKFFLTYFSGFFVGSVFLKNIINRPRPYDVNKSLFAERFSYSGSLPSAGVMITSEVSSYFFYEKFLKEKTKKSIKTLAIFFLFVFCLLVGFSKIYFAQNYLLDVLLGIFLGVLTTFFVFKFVKQTKENLKYFLFLLVPIFVLFLVYIKFAFSNNFVYSAVYDFCGLSSSILLGYFLEEKYVGYKIKNNAIYTSFKIFTTVVILLGYYFFCKYILPGILIFSFLKYFLIGFLITLFLPILFKSLDKYFYVFTNKIDEKNVLMSSVSFSEKGTQKIAKRFSKTLKKGDVVLLTGDLGAGKSFFVRSVLKNLGVKDNITSPTFTLVNEYKTPSNHFYHFDMYRIEDEEEVTNIDFEEIVDDKNSIKFIEWPEKVSSYLPKNCKKLTIIKLGEKSRNIILEKIKN